MQKSKVVLLRISCSLTHSLPWCTLELLHEFQPVEDTVAAQATASRWSPLDTQVMNLFRIGLGLLKKERKVSRNGVMVLLLSVQF